MPFLAQEHIPIPTKDISSWTFDDFSKDWDEPIYVDGNNPKNSISARQALSLTRKLAAGFKAIGVEKGDCVCINSFNDIHYPIFFHGLVAAGCVFTGVNPSYTPYELAHTLKIAKVKYILTQPDMLEKVLKAADEVGLPKKNVVIFNPNGESAPSGFAQWKDLLQHGEQVWEHFDDLNRSSSTAAARLFSSGTTGLPKATDLTHYNLIAQHTLVYGSNTRNWRRSAILNLPMFHAATIPMAFTSTLKDGCLGVVFPRFDPETWFPAHEKFGITDLTVVPPMAIMAINHRLKDVCSLKSVKVGNCGAAPLDKHPQSRLQALLANDAPFTQVWGMTETSCIATTFPYPEDDNTGSVGRPVPNLDFKLVNEDGKDISDYNVQGEICVRGPSVVRGYFENPEANKRDWDEDNYFHTGDIGYCDRETKKWYIVDRKKELIKVRAFQVAPPELEGVLLSHPEIVDAAVIGVPDPSNREGSEAPRAYIVRKDAKSNSPSEQEVAQYMKERLASYKALTGGIVFVDAIPKNPSGKILKRILREQAKKEMGAKL